MANVLEIKKLSKHYPTFSLKEVSFCVEEGEIMGFVGRNGAGKTTTLKSILNLVHPDSGTVEAFGVDILSAEDTCKQQIGYAVGGSSYYKRKKIKDIISVTKTFYKSWDDDAYRHYLSAFGLDENKRIMELSEGMKVKFHLTIALSHHAKLLILDEPTSGLDPVSRDEICEIFKQLSKKGVAILFSSHITSDLEKCADSITYIKNGEIVASKKKAAFLEDFSDRFEQPPTLEDIMVHIEKKEVRL